MNYILSQHRDYFNLEDSKIINKFSSKIINPLDDNRILKFKDLMLHNNQELWMDLIHFNMKFVFLNLSKRVSNLEEFSVRSLEWKVLKVKKICKRWIIWMKLTILTILKR